jgi:hypothetical protein
VTYYLKLGPPPTDLQPPKNSATSWRWCIWHELCGIISYSNNNMASYKSSSQNIEFC